MRPALRKCLRRTARCIPLLAIPALIVSIASAQTITEIIDGSGDGEGNTLYWPYGIDVDRSGNVYVVGLFAIPEESQVRLSVFDVVGRKVALLRDEFTPPGTYTVTWDATDAQGRVLPSGLYFYRIEAAEFAETRTMSLLK